MLIGSLTCWNFEDWVGSREYQYLLHCLSKGEKDPIMEDLWLQHSDEMRLLEGNVLAVCGIQCIVEFQPSTKRYSYKRTDALKVPNKTPPWQIKRLALGKVAQY